MLAMMTNGTIKLISSVNRAFCVNMITKTPMIVMMLRKALIKTSVYMLLRVSVSEVTRVTSLPMGTLLNCAIDNPST